MEIAIEEKQKQKNLKRQKRMNTLLRIGKENMPWIPVELAPNVLCSFFFFLFFAHRTNI